MMLVQLGLMRKLHALPMPLAIQPLLCQCVGKHGHLLHRFGGILRGIVLVAAQRSAAARSANAKASSGL